MSQVFDNYTPFAGAELITVKTTPRGRKRFVRVEDCDTLVLAWTLTKGSINVLQLIFGMTMTNLMSTCILDAAFLSIYSVMINVQEFPFLPKTTLNLMCLQSVHDTENSKIDKSDVQLMD